MLIARLFQRLAELGHNVESLVREGCEPRIRIEALVPFVDKDGVEEGDQGKNRAPRDHNRDYAGASMYPETGALRELGEGA